MKKKQTELKFITGNKNKFREAKEILLPIKVRQINLDLPEIQEIDAEKIIMQKLVQACGSKGKNYLVEDTSLYFNALGGYLPGPLIKWFQKGLGEKKLFNLTKKLKNNKATAISFIGYAKDKNHIQYFEGRTKGIIVSPKGDSRFGWDNIFKPNGSKKTFGQMTTIEKSKLSMRKFALEKLKKYLS